METKIETRGGKRDGAGRPKGIKKPYKPIALSLPAEYADRMKQLAEQEQISISKLLQKMIDNYS